MANLLLCDAALSDASTIYSISSQQSYAPATNLLLSRQPKEIWESTGVAGTQELRFDLGASASYNFLALLFTNATDAATVTWQGSANSGFIGTAWTSGSQTFVKPGQYGGLGGRTRRHGFYFPGTQTARYVRFQISDTANPAGVFRAGRFVCGKAYQPALNVVFPLGFGFDDEAPTTVTGSGERITRVNEPVPALAFTFEANGPTAKDDFYGANGLHEIMRRVGAAKDVVVVIDPDDASYAGAMVYHGTLQRRAMVALEQHELYRASFELTGLL